MEDNERHQKQLENMQVSRGRECSKNERGYSYALGSTTKHCVNKASRTGRSASAGVCQIRLVKLRLYLTIVNYCLGRKKNVKRIGKTVTG